MTSIIPDLLCDKLRIVRESRAPGSQVSFRLPLRALCKILCKSGFSISRSDEEYTANWPLSKKRHRVSNVQRTKLEVADIIERFLNGTGVNGTGMISPPLA